MGTTDESAIGWLFAKIGSVWALVGITSWAEFSYFIASVYTTCLLGHWIWKTFISRIKSRDPE